MPFDHNDHYHRLLLRQIPVGCRTALDVGCGTGRFARRLAGLGIEVTAVDASADVLSAAHAAHPGQRQPRYRQADVTTLELPAGHYDFISCLSSLHHMPFDTLGRLRDALAPGGVLAVLGPYAERTAADYAWALAAVPVNAVVRTAVAAKDLACATPVPLRPPVRPADMPLAVVRREAAALLPGCTVRRLLFWRFLLVYRQEAVTAPRPAGEPRASRRRDDGDGVPPVPERGNQAQGREATPSTG